MYSSLVTEEGRNLLTAVALGRLCCTTVTCGASCTLLLWRRFRWRDAGLVRGRCHFAHLVWRFDGCCVTVIFRFIMLTFDAFGCCWNGQWRVIFGSLDAVRSRTSFVDVVFYLYSAVPHRRVSQVMLSLLCSLLVSLGLGGLLLVPEEVGNIVLVFCRVNGHEEGGRVVSDFAYILAHRVALELAVVWLEQRLQVFGPFCARGVKPRPDGVGAVVQYDGHAVVQKVELFVGVGGDDGVGIELLARV